MLNANISSISAISWCERILFIISRLVLPTDTTNIKKNLNLYYTSSKISYKIAYPQTLVDSVGPFIPPLGVKRGDKAFNNWRGSIGG